MASLFNQDYDQLFLVGESIGTCVAASLENQYSARTKSVLLITPFTSLVDVGKVHYPIFPIALLLRDRYDYVESLKGYGGPVAFLIAGADEIVPPSLGYQL